ncbi:MAG: carbon starvation protein, putative membrane protein [Halorubrum sp. J07HR59]|nr:MAG: carbon starvation protein, putative membrane protein [Halorubrum sp. J07HR59]
MVQILWIVTSVLVTFTIAYIGYSRYLAQFLELDDTDETPAHKYEDGHEYVPAKKPVLLGHHFSSIAGGAPIIGPITAGAVWGWVPALLWIVIGNPLMGAVHDFVSLSGSLRHEGRSIGYMLGEYVGDRGKDMLLWFAFLTVILVVAVFARVVALVFTAYPAVVTVSTLYIALALIFGVYLYQFNGPLIPGTVLFVAGVFASVWVGIQYPVALFELAGAASHAEGTIVLFSGVGSWVPGAAALGGNTAGWIPIVMIYSAIASSLPVWVLLQPRDYLSSFLLYTGVGGAVVAIIVGSLFSTASQPLVVADSIGAWNGFWGIEGVFLPLFPLLFLTIACGTISGFHSLVSSGTTAKQLDKESDARAIGYGGMLGEGLLASVALSTIAIAGATAGTGIDRALPNFADGGGIMLTSLGVPVQVGSVFMALVLVSFLLTSTDTAVRLGRYMMEEIVEVTLGQNNAGFGGGFGSLARGRYTNPILQVVPAYLLVISDQWTVLWALFGGANQLLAALALLTATVWLANWDSTKQLVSTGVPMAIMATITILGLAWLALYENLYTQILQGSAEITSADISSGVQIVLAFVLIGLALALIRMGYESITNTRQETETPAADLNDD